MHGTNIPPTMPGIAHCVPNGLSHRLHAANDSNYSNGDIDVEDGIKLITALPVTTGSPGDGIGPEAGRLRLSHWAGPSVTRSARDVSDVEQGYHSCDSS